MCIVTFLNDTILISILNLASNAKFTGVVFNLGDLRGGGGVPGDVVSSSSSSSSFPGDEQLHMRFVQNNGTR